MTTARPGSLRRLIDVVAEASPTGIAVFTGGRSFSASGAIEIVARAVNGLPIARIGHVTPNPTLEDVVRAREQYLKVEPELIIAVGGGSVIDLAKTVRAVAKAPDVRTAITDGPPAGTGPPLVAIPTTAGTGSEATHFATVYIDGVKHSVTNRNMRPDVVILDPELTASLPPDITASTGLDALAQAIESMWSTRSTEESRRYSAAALDRLTHAIEGAVLEPDLALRTAMLDGAHLAGRAIDISRTTAAHALSYALTARYGVPHGHAAALTLGPLLVYNAAVSDADVRDSRGVRHVRTVIAAISDLLGAADAERAGRSIQQLIERIGLPARLSAVGVHSADDRAALAESVDVERLDNNPRALTHERLVALLGEIR